jgi:hypothetical protein
MAGSDAPVLLCERLVLCSKENRGNCSAGKLLDLSLAQLLRVNATHNFLTPDTSAASIIVYQEHTGRACGYKMTSQAAVGWRDNTSPDSATIA